MTEKNQFYSLQGHVYMSKYDTNGVLGAWYDIGNMDGLSFSITENVIDVLETQTGNSGTVATIKNGIKTELTGTLKELNQQNINMLLRAVGSKVLASTVNDEVLGLSFAQYSAGSRDVLLSKLGASSVVVTSALATTVSGVNVEQADFGIITLPDGLVANDFPLQADYTSKEYTSSGMLTQDGAVYSLRFNGLNRVTGGANKKMLVEFYRVTLSPAKTIELLTADAKVMQTELDATVLIDLNKPASNELGQYGRVVTI